MCSSKPKLKLNGRPVLQPTCNRVSSLDQKRTTSLHNSKPSPKPPQGLASSPPASPKLPSPRQPALKRGKQDPSDLTSSADKAGSAPRGSAKPIASSVKKPKSSAAAAPRRALPKEVVVDGAPGSIAAARREQVAIVRTQRKLKIAHYGRTNPAKYLAKAALELDSPPANGLSRELKRCCYITPNSDPIYVAYHDDEWGVPVHDDKLLFELLVLTGAQVGSDWTSVLKKRETFREAFSGFDAEAVSQYNEKKITSISAHHGIDLKLIRGAVDNAIRILEIKKGFGTLDKYLWGFVNQKPISTQYKSCQRIPVKTSKSESISKDLVRRGFRFVGPTMIHSFMQASGLTNDHLITCPRHLQCIALASQGPTVAPAL